MTDFDDDSRLNAEEMSLNIGTTGLTAAAFDYFGLKDVLRGAIGKVGSHVVLDNPELVQALVMQVLSVPYQSLYGTSEFFQDKPIAALLGVKHVELEDLNRVNLARCLDEIYNFGPERLFLRCAKQVAIKLGAHIEECHLDSTSFHYDGQTREEEGVDLILDKGYSRDGHPELNQVNHLQICDAFTKIPFFFKSVSGHVHDKTSFRNLLIDDISFIKKEFQDLRYFVGDSALCTEPIVNIASGQDFFIVTRLPDSYVLSKECFEYAKEHKDEFTPVEPDVPDSPKALWCPDCKIGGQSFKRLLVQSELLSDKKKHTLRKQAEKELESAAKQIEKLRTQPCKCKPDAEDKLKKIISKLRFCTVSDVKYEDIMGFKGKGRPKKDAAKEVIAVAVSAKIEINDSKVEQAVKEGSYFVVCTNDMKRKWTQKDLLGIYKRQSVVERNWKCFKERKIMVSALYLKTPHRISALMWIFSLAMLIYTATEYLIRQRMKYSKLTIPSPDHKQQQEKPTLMRLYQYISNSNISLYLCPDSGIVKLLNLRTSLSNIFIAMGDEWNQYYTRGLYHRTYLG
jgi:transposase